MLIFSMAVVSPFVISFFLKDLYHCWSLQPPLFFISLYTLYTALPATASYIHRLIALRSIFNELAWTEQLSELAHLIRRQDIPRLPQRLPRPLTPEQDELLQQELRLRNDLGSNVFLLIRHTGMRIDECADLSFDCLRSTGSNQWAVHVPLGKLKTERMVPVDSFVCELVRRLQF